jgi:hypothetical protein
MVHNGAIFMEQHAPTGMICLHSQLKGNFSIVGHPMACFPVSRW